VPHLVCCVVFVSALVLAAAAGQTCQGRTPISRRSIASAPRTTPPVALNPSATCCAPVVIDIAYSTFDFNLARVSFFAGRRRHGAGL
jgi:hypothetical protein